MSKVTRHTPKQHHSTNKQTTSQPTNKQTTTTQTAKQGQQTTSQAIKEAQPVIKQTANQTSKQAQPSNKQGTNQPADQAASKQMLRRNAMLERRQEEQKRREAERQRTVQKKRITIASILAVTLLLVAGLSYLIYTNSTHPNNGPTANPVPIDPRYPVIDNVSCDGQEQTAFHIHAHVSIYINGQPATIPADVGIGGGSNQTTCLYWMHTHSPDGVLHMEGPGNFTPTLGKFLDIWGQSFTSMQFQSQLDQKGGPSWQVYVDGKPYNGDFHNIVLQNHTLVTLAYNSPGVKPDTTFNWPQGT